MYMDSKRVGIITTTTPLFSSGLAQNAFFIYEALTNAGNACDLFVYGPEYKLSYKDILVKTITQSADDFIYENYKTVITVGNGVTKLMYEKFKSYGIKVFGFVCGNVLPMHMAAFISDKSKSSIVTKSQPVDKLWIIDSFSYMKTYVELLRGAPAISVPHLWSPILLEDAVINRFKKSIKDITYSPKHSTKINILILEPNIDIVKNALIPIMAAEKLHQTYPELINEVYIFNFPEYNSAHTIIDNLTIRPRTRIFKSQHIGIVLSHFNLMDVMPIFVSHQILTPWNYFYYELMYYGFPLVHNSDLLKSYCYFYPNYDIDLCAAQIKKAFDMHNANYETQQLLNRIYLEGIDPKKTCNYWNHLIK